jgi:hypothetical protein
MLSLTLIKPSRVRSHLALCTALAVFPGCVSFFRATPDNTHGQNITPLQASHYAWQARNSGSVAGSLAIALAGSAVAFMTAAAFDVDRTRQFGVLPVVFVSNAVINVLLSIGYTVSTFQANDVALEWTRLPVASQPADP